MFMNVFFRDLIKHLDLRFIANKDEIQQALRAKHAKKTVTDLTTGQ